VGRRGRKGGKQRERKQHASRKAEPESVEVYDSKTGKTYKWTQPGKPERRHTPFNASYSHTWELSPSSRPWSRATRLKGPPGQFKEAASQLPNLDTPIIIDIVVPTTEQWETRAIQIPVEKFIL
jgi:hypothetical protein